MGEYAKVKGTGEEVKIGTCEDMYYLRADQADAVWPVRGNVDPVRDANGIRFRFPWPDEDGIAPGGFDDHDRGLVVWGATAPEIDHHRVQFKADNGYLVSLPCPEGDGAVFDAKGEPLTIHRNGYGGAVRIVQQRYWEGRLVLVCECKGCSARYRCPTLADAASVLEGLAAIAEREIRTAELNGTPGNADIGARYLEIARRIVAGYELDTQRATDQAIEDAASMPGELGDLGSVSA